MFISGIYANSSAQEQGLQTGDQIIILDGNDFESLDASEICGLKLNARELLKFKGKNILILTVLRNQQRIALELQRTKIL